MNVMKENKHGERQDDLTRLQNLCPLDDAEFLRCIFRDNLPLAQMFLRVVTRKSDLAVTALKNPKEIMRAAGTRSICLAARAHDASGKEYVLEVHKIDCAADTFRARYSASCMDAENLNADQRYEELPETYAIFITRCDIFGKGAPIYPVERFNLTAGEVFDDGKHILYVNGAYRGDNDIGKLMHDFSCSDPDDMQIELLCETTRYYKENAEGVEIMCKAFEEVRAEAAEHERLRNIKSIMDSLKLTAEQAMDALRIPEADRPKYLARL